MSDLISRQAAIDAICEDGTWLESQGCTEITMAERKQRDADLLSELPSAQPERLTDDDFEKRINASDLIEWILEAYPDWCVGAVRSIVDHVEGMPSAQPEKTEYIPESKAIPTARSCVDLSEKVTATFYSAENEEWTRQTVTIADVLDSVCDEYTILPSAQPERWIPCSEKLPDDLAEVNVTYVNHNPAPYYDFTKDKPLTSSAVFFKGRWYWYSSTCADYLGEYGRNDVDKVDDAIEITAWMPLPEPYAERRADDDELHHQF